MSSPLSSEPDRGSRVMLIEMNLHYLTPTQAPKRVGHKRTHLEAVQYSQWSFHLNPVDAPGYTLMVVQLSQVATLMVAPEMGWTQARARLIYNGDFFDEVPVSWYARPTDMPTGMVRWMGWQPDSGDFLLTIGTVA